ncbi:unnamed protein product, partial [marine sediment metagenome]
TDIALIFNVFHENKTEEFYVFLKVFVIPRFVNNCSV